MLKLTKEQKKEVMELVLELLLKDQAKKAYWGYICNFIREAIDKLGHNPSGKWITQEMRAKIFPELIKYKPESVVDKYGAWWDDKAGTFDYDSRIKVVKVLIEEYS